MILILMRHGNAARDGEGRPLRLTGRGKGEVAAVARLLREKNLPPPAIWHSPKPRTAETAAILAREAGWEGLALEEKAQLTPDGDEEAVYRDLMAERPGCLVLISHQPLLEKMAHLLGSEAARDLQFPTAGLQAFEWDGGWKWLWSLDPFPKG